MNKILVIRFSSIGDIVLTTPVIRCLGKQLPGAEVHVLTKKQYAPLLEANPYVTRVHLFGGKFRDVLPALRDEKFDFIADLHRNIRSFYIRLMLMRPSGTFPKLNIRKFLLAKLHINMMPPVHIVDRYFRAVRRIGITNDGQGLDYFLTEEDAMPISSLPPSHQGGFIAFAIGAKHNTKIYPAPQVAEVCKRMSLPVILLGGPEDRQRGEEVAAAAGSHVFNACGLWTVNRSASVIRMAQGVITNDTGMMHIAAAFKKPVVSIWGNTVPAFGMYPYLPDDKKNISKIIQVEGLSCRPCSKLGYRECPKGHFNCMKQIDPETVANAL